MNGRAWGVGVGYTYQAWPFDEGFGLNVDVGLNSNEGEVTRRFIGWTAGFQWTPR